MKRCPSCRYFEVQKRHEDWGWCRRRAPLPSNLLDAEDPGPEDPDHEGPTAWWPRVYEDDWCGEWKISGGNDRESTREGEGEKVGPKSNILPTA